MTFAAGPFVGLKLDQAGADDATRLAVRGLWCLALQLPWCLAGLGLAARPARPIPAAAWALALLAALAPPAVYAWALADAWAEQAAEALDEGRLRRAEILLTELADVAGNRPVGGVPLPRVRARVERALEPVRAAVARPLPPDSPPAAQIDYARQLAQLDRLAEAEQLLAPLAGRDVDAALLRATALQKLARWDESDHDFRTALDLLAAAPDPGRAAAEQLQAYEGLAYNARAAGRPADAEAAYRAALERVPSAAAHVHLQMGRHYAAAGRPGLALEHLHEAVRLDPGLAAQARPLTDQVRRSTPSCLLPRPAGGELPVAAPPAR
jgi:tetratricopeptide (TPR) repeat protein